MDSSGRRHRPVLDGRALTLHSFSTALESQPASTAARSLRLPITAGVGVRQTAVVVLVPIDPTARRGGSGGRGRGDSRMDERDQEPVDEHQLALRAGTGAHGPHPRPRDQLCLVTLMP